MKLMDKRFYFTLLTIICFGFHPVSAQNTLPVIPKPVSEEVGVGAFTISQENLINTAHDTRVEAEFLQRAIKDLYGLNIDFGTRAGHTISLEINPAIEGGAEAYTLKVMSDQIKITAPTRAGIFYGVQTLIQLAAQSPQIPACEIRDYPRFSYRGLHLDVSRHMFSVDFLKKYLDLMALYKLNTFHWHLTDDQGWRIEIQRYPRLQSVAAYRDETIIGHKKDSPHRFDGQRYGGYYTQEEVREIVKYAAERHITVIPEIEMPGHASAALAAYPELGCRQEGYNTATFWGIFDDAYCAGNEETFTFLENVLEEVMELFPSKFIHIGGDECSKNRWQACPKCRKRIQEENLKDEDELQSYFVHRMERFLNTKGREIIGWDEILEGGLSPNATVMSWRGEAGGIEAASQKHDVVMSPDNYLYLDYYQSLSLDEPIAAAWYLPLKKVYEYEPLPTDLEPEFHPYIKGIQANVWTEYMPDSLQVEYMTFPRAIAMAETA